MVNVEALETPRGVPPPPPPPLSPPFESEPNAFSREDFQALPSRIEAIRKESDARASEIAHLRTVNQQLRAEIRKEKAAREETEAIAKMRANGEEREYEAQISALRKNVERLREDYNRIQAETENVHSHNESLRDIKLAYASLKGACVVLNEEKKSFLTDRDELKRRCDSLQRHLVDALERYEKLDAEKTSLEGENEKLNYDVELLSSAETENVQLKSKIAELQKELASCSDAELRDEVKRLTVENKSISEMSKSLKSTSEQLRREVEEFRVDAARKMREIPSLKMALERTQSELQASTTELALRNKCLSAKDETIAVLMNKLRDANEDIEQCSLRSEKRNSEPNTGCPKALQLETTRYRAAFIAARATNETFRVETLKQLEATKKKLLQERLNVKLLETENRTLKESRELTDKSVENLVEKIKVDLAHDLSEALSAARDLSTASQRCADRCSKEPEAKKEAKDPKAKKAPKPKVEVPGMKKPLNAFLAFSVDERPSVKAENPTFNFREVGKALGERWASLDPERKAKYESDWKTANEAYTAALAKARGHFGSVQRIV
jgi:chromosome segregation ATPase